MKKFNIILASLAFTGLFSSCGDIMDTESTRQAFDPQLDEKTDSAFYTYGILQGLQQLADQHVLVNELRGDLVNMTKYSETALQQLYNFQVTADTENKYDSAYIYYRIINNCNYYLAHRDTTLRTGARRVAIPEYVQALAIRAWTYMQLAKNYGSVYFFTEPITLNSQLKDVDKKYPKYNMKQICDALAPQMERYKGTPVPTYVTEDAGTPNWSNNNKTFSTSNCMLPVDIVLGDLYLETNDYEKAANAYWSYLYTQRKTVSNRIADYANFPISRRGELPTDLNNSTIIDLNERNTAGSIDKVSLNSLSTWDNAFTMNNTSDLISYIPMAVNKLRGTTSRLPVIFGYDFYANTLTDILVQPQIVPSKEMTDLVNAQNFYYTPANAVDTIVTETAIGDMRYYSSVNSSPLNSENFDFIIKYNGSNVYLYRTSIVYLRLAEAFNRMGYPDAAFAILKDGLDQDLAVLPDSITYLTAKTRNDGLLTDKYPFFANSSIFFSMLGIHNYGSGLTSGRYSPYQYDTIVAKKLNDMKANLNYVDTGDSLTNYINAVEDLIIDEYALECAFEGHRWADLTRIANHKNADDKLTTNYGNTWLQGKMKRLGSAVDFNNKDNWYLPFK